VYFDCKNKIQGIGGVINKVLCTTEHYLENNDADIEIDDDNASTKIDYIIGASFFITKKVLDDIGDLSEDYFLYFEEIDYCLRAKEKGYGIYPVSESIVYHKEEHQQKSK
jgi:GT2 family glycosyltransferase